ncbi:MAG TPA: MurT ligase domain-containing protein [Acidimicrobiales bacterium]|nr:MurT ligase domain-containing protein [Acidimicrobiales bacterium]
MGDRLTIRDHTAKLVVLGVNFVSRLTGRGSGTVIGGRLGLQVSPGLLTSLSRNRSIVLVSGTNGKTTTTSMVVAGWGPGTATNATGANMPAGHVAALSADASPQTVLEVDEAWLPVVLSATRARVVVLLNLSRDQLDRANEVRLMAERWRAALANVGAGSMTVVANANDPLVVYAALGAAQVLWCDVPTTWLADATSCPMCTGVIEFDGSDWRCVCGFHRPEVITTALGDELTIGGVTVGLALAMPGEFNRANAAMALTALGVFGVSPTEAVGRINAVDNVAGRFSLRHWQGHAIRLLLAKNPAGFTAMLSTIPYDDSDVWIAINARIADGRDPSWLYDVGFESLRGHRVFCLGDRRLDLATRLDYAGVDFVVVNDESHLQSGDEPVRLLANYTAFSDWLARSSP